MTELRSEQLLPITIDKAWGFFSTPRNLNLITPNDMIFEIQSEVPEKMHEGLLIQYKIRPFMNIPFRWTTEITHIKEKEYFIDEQRFGPYRFWHHEHHFRQTKNGVLMTDILHYDVGKWVFGEVANKFFVHKKVQQIFDFRHQKLTDIFGKITL